MGLFCVTGHAVACGYYPDKAIRLLRMLLMQLFTSFVSVNRSIDKLVTASCVTAIDPRSLLSMSALCSVATDNEGLPSSSCQTSEFGPRVLELQAPWDQFTAALESNACFTATFMLVADKQRQQDRLWLFEFR